MPRVAEWIFETAGAVSIKLILDRPCQLRTRVHGALNKGIDIFNVEHDADRCTAEGFWTAEVHFGIFIGHHDPRISDLDFSVGDLAVRLCKAHELLRAECFLIEFQSFGGAFDTQNRGYRPVTLGYRFDFVRHKRVSFRGHQIHLGILRYALPARISCEAHRALDIAVCGDMKYPRSLSFLISEIGGLACIDASCCSWVSLSPYSFLYPWLLQRRAAPLHPRYPDRLRGVRRSRIRRMVIRSAPRRWIWLRQGISKRSSSSRVQQTATTRLKPTRRRPARSPIADILTKLASLCAGRCPNPS